MQAAHRVGHLPCTLMHQAVTCFGAGTARPSGRRYPLELKIKKSNFDPLHPIKNNSVRIQTHCSNATLPSTMATISDVTMEPESNSGFEPTDNEPLLLWITKISRFASARSHRPLRTLRDVLSLDTICSYAQAFGAAGPIIFTGLISVRAYLAISRLLAGSGTSMA